MYPLYAKIRIAFEGREPHATSVYARHRVEHWSEPRIVVRDAFGSQPAVDTQERRNKDDPQKPILASSRRGT